MGNEDAHVLLEMAVSIAISQFVRYPQESTTYQQLYLQWNNHPFEKLHTKRILHWTIRKHFLCVPKCMCSPNDWRKWMEMEGCPK